MKALPLKAVAPFVANILDCILGFLTALPLKATYVCITGSCNLPHRHLRSCGTSCADQRQHEGGDFDFHCNFNSSHSFYYAYTFIMLTLFISMFIHVFVFSFWRCLSVCLSCLFPFVCLFCLCCSVLSIWLFVLLLCFACLSSRTLE